VLPTSTATATLVTANSQATGLQGESADASGTPAPTWTPPPLDPARQIADHYFMGRPIADGGTNWIDRTYPYGGTAGGRFESHLGVEFVNPGGTPILAVEAGTVIYAGEDSAVQFGPYPNYYGNLVVIQHAFTTPDGQPVFSLYGHMDRFEVSTGQAVTRGQHVGSVGATGIAMGAHLHFEVRVGDPYSYTNTRNPELWIRPFPTYGTLAGRTLDAAGNRLYQVSIQVKSARITRYAFSYADDRVNPDAVFGEHFTLGDLPADYYEISVTADGRVRYREVAYIYPNRTTWVDIQLNP
jgi:murein DD-endopeptidase MepM/ murein hydrolase activator NlpD